MNQNLDKNDLINAIRAAFGKTQLGHGLTLHEANALSDYSSEDKVAAARQQGKDIHWQDISKDDLERLWWGLVYLDPKGFCYYVPAYVTWFLNYGETTTSAAALDFLNGMRGHQGWFHLLTDEQREVVTSFLAYVSAVDPSYGEDAKEALDSLRPYLKGSLIALADAVIPATSIRHSPR